MELKCSKCGHVWDYKGKSAFLVNCPNCHRKNKVLIKENLVFAEMASCKACGREFFKKEKRSRYCTPDCQRTAAGKLGAKAVRQKHDFTGENNPNWKGGITKDNYHYKKIQDERYPEKVKARRKLQSARKSGKIIPPSTCQHCGSKTKLHGHHDDYSKPFDVIWLCRPCHRKLHGGIH